MRLQHGFTASDEMIDLPDAGELPVPERLAVPAAPVAATVVAVRVARLRR